MSGAVLNEITRGTCGSKGKRVSIYRFRSPCTTRFVCLNIPIKNMNITAQDDSCEQNAHPRWDGHAGDDHLQSSGEVPVAALPQDADGDGHKVDVGSRRKNIKDSQTRTLHLKSIPDDVIVFWISENLEASKSRYSKGNSAHLQMKEEYSSYASPMPR